MGFLLERELIPRKDVKVKLCPNDDESINLRRTIRDFASVEGLRFYVVEATRKRSKSKSQQEIQTPRKLEGWAEKSQLEPGCCHRDGCLMF